MKISEDLIQWLLADKKVKRKKLIKLNEFRNALR